MNLAINVLDSVIYHLMRVISSQSLVRQKEIGVQCAANFYVLADFGLNRPVDTR